MSLQVPRRDIEEFAEGRHLPQEPGSDQVQKTYGKEVELFRVFLRQNHLQSSKHMDHCIALYLKRLFWKGEQPCRGEKLLAGWMHGRPRYGRIGDLKLSRSWSWRALKGWRRLCPGNSRKPMFWERGVSSPSNWCECSRSEWPCFSWRHFRLTPASQNFFGVLQVVSSPIQECSGRVGSAVATGAGSADQNRGVRRLSALGQQVPWADTLSFKAACRRRGSGGATVSCCASSLGAEPPIASSRCPNSLRHAPRPQAAVTSRKRQCSFFLSSTMPGLLMK